MAQGKESELAGLRREAVTLQLHVPLHPVNAGFVGKDCKSALIHDNNMGDKTKYAAEVLTPCRSVGDPLCDTNGTLFAIFWTACCLVLSQLIKG